MTSQAAQTDELVRLILERAACGAEAAEQDENAQEYDWTRPHVLSPDQVERLVRLSDSSAGALAGALTQTLGRDVELSAVRPSEQYAKDVFRDQQDDQHETLSVLLRDQQGEPCGTISVPAVVASAWVAKLLGSGDVKAREMSSLELAILSDVLNTLTEAFASSLLEAGYPSIRCDREPADRVGSSFQPDDGMTVFDNQAGDEQVVRFVLCDDFLCPAATDLSAGREQLQQQILAALGEVRLDVQVLLGKAELTLREAASLSCDDVLVTDTRIGQPVELTVDGVAVLTGLPASYEGFYALKVLRWLTPPAEGAREEQTHG